MSNLKSFNTKSHDKEKEKIVIKLGKLIENMPLVDSIKSESDLEYALLPDIKKFIKDELFRSDVENVLYHHGRTMQEKKHWADSKPLQVVKLFGVNVSDIFIKCSKVGAVAIELKYAEISKRKGLTSFLQRAIGQSLIATLRHPFAICCIFYRQSYKNKIEIGLVEKLKKILWRKHKIYLIVRKN